MRVFFFRLKAKIGVFLSNLKNPKFHTFKRKIPREERFREAYDVITEELSSSSSLKFARQRERERERERKEHTRTRNLKPRERERTTTHRKSRHRHVFCATTTTPPVVEFDFDLLRNDQKNTVRKIRHREIFFSPLSLSLSLSRASGRVVSRRDRPLEEVFCFTLLFLLCLLLLLLLDDDDDDEKCARKEIQRIGIRGGFLKALWFFCPKCDSATRRIQRIRCIQNARFRRRKVVRVTLN